MASSMWATMVYPAQARMRLAPKATWRAERALFSHLENFPVSRAAMACLRSTDASDPELDDAIEMCENDELMDGVGEERPPEDS